MRLLPVLGALAAAAQALAFKVAIKDTDSFHEVCSGMYGGDKAYINVAFGGDSNGQVSLVIYEWGDVEYLGVKTPSTEADPGFHPKTYICTTSAVRAGLCNVAEIGAFITSIPEGRAPNSTTIYTTALRLMPNDDLDPSELPTPPTMPNKRQDETAPEDEAADAPGIEEAGTSSDALMSDLSPGDTVVKPAQNSSRPNAGSPSIPASEVEGNVPLYSNPIRYDVPKTGYYCVGVVPVTLVDARSLSKRDDEAIDTRASVHAKYQGMVTFRNQYEGELPATEYPKIGFYQFLSIVYVLLTIGWGVLCVKHYRELLPMQYYISGTIVFLVIEMLALFTYYRYINKHGGGAGATAFLILISVLNAARNSMSFFLLLIVAMGLSVVTQSLGKVMTRVWLLTGFHFVFGVLYAMGTVKVQMDSAAIMLVLLMIFPLSITLTSFLMWIIVSLNGTILHLQERKQNFKLQMFQRLWRILIISVIAVVVFFVLSSISLSNRMNEDYAPRNWRWRWVLLDASLAIIYLVAFASVAWLWRPTENNVRFAMSQELAQDENDAEDYEIGELGEHDDDDIEAQHRAAGGYGLGLGLEGSNDNREHIHGDGPSEESRRLFPQGPTGRGLRDKVGGVHDDNVVFAMGDDSDSDDDDHDDHRRNSDSDADEGSRLKLSRSLSPGGLPPRTSSRQSGASPSPRGSVAYRDDEPKFKDKDD